MLGRQAGALAGAGWAGAQGCCYLVLRHVGLWIGLCRFGSRSRCTRQDASNRWRRGRQPVSGRLGQTVQGSGGAGARSGGSQTEKWERSSRGAEQWGHCKARACVASSCKRASGVVVWLEVQVRQNHLACSGGRGEGVVGTEVTGSGRTSAMGHRASSGH